MKDYYRILQVSRTSTAKDIRKKFKQLVLEYHPDVCKQKNAHEVFIVINEAYQILSDENKRQLYNQIYDKYSVNAGGNTQGSYPKSDPFHDVVRQARSKAQRSGKTKYMDYIKTLNCHFNPAYKADGKPYNFYVHRTGNIVGGRGPMGSIPSKMVTIPIPRSKETVKNHRTALYIKWVALLTAISTLFLQFADNTILNYAFSISTLLIGGVITKVFYRYKNTAPIFLYAKKYELVQTYLKKGYSVGFHPAISTSPIGLVYLFLRIIL